MTQIIVLAFFVFPVQTWLVLLVRDRDRKIEILNDALLRAERPDVAAITRHAEPRDLTEQELEERRKQQAAAQALWRV